MNVLFERAPGFTLIEVLVVLSLLGLVVAMLPGGLSALNTRASHQSLVHKTVAAARHCALLAQEQQSPVRLGSQACPLPASFNDKELGVTELSMTAKTGGLRVSGHMPWFHADGTASHTAHIVIEDGSGGATVVEITRLTANVSISKNAQAQ